MRPAAICYGNEGSELNAANLRRYVFIMCQKAIIYEIMSRNISYALES